MNNLREYITEKFKINSKNVNKIDFVNTILSFIYTEPEDASQEEIKVLTNWVKTKGVKKIDIITRSDILKKYGMIESISEIDEIKEKIENDNVKIRLVDDHQYYDFERNLNNDNDTEEIYKSKYDNEGSFIIFRNDSLNLLAYHFKLIGYIFFISK